MGDLLRKLSKSHVSQLGKEVDAKTLLATLFFYQVMNGTSCRVNVILGLKIEMTKLCVCGGGDSK